MGKEIWRLRCRNLDVVVIALNLEDARRVARIWHPRFEAKEWEKLGTTDQYKTSRVVVSGTWTNEVPG